MKKPSILGIVVKDDHQNPVLIDTLSDENEILLIQESLESGEKNPLRDLHHHRTHRDLRETEMEDRVEELLCQPFLDPEIQAQGIQWLKSKIKIEQYQAKESEAARVIAEFALQIFKTDPTKTDFLLSSQKSQVRIRVFLIPEEMVSESAA